MRSARSGSLLIATIPRWLVGISPEVDGLGVAQRPALGHLIGSTSPIRSATPVSGVASFGEASERCRHETCVGRRRTTPRAALRGVGDRPVGVLAQPSRRSPATTVEQADQRAAAGSVLAALPSSNDVVAGDERLLELRDHGVPEAAVPATGRDSRGRRAGCRGPLAQRLTRAGGMQLSSDRADLRWAVRGRPRYSSTSTTGDRLVSCGFWLLAADPLHDMPVVRRVVRVWLPAAETRSSSASVPSNDPARAGRGGDVTTPGCGWLRRGAGPGGAPPRS